MAETPYIHSKLRYEIRQSVSFSLDDCVLVTPDSGTATTMVDANLVEADDFYNYWSLAVYAGTHVDAIRTVSDFANATGTLTIATVTTAVDTTDLSELHKIFTTAQYNDAINRAIEKTKHFWWYPNVDETLHMMAYKKGVNRSMQREYDIPTYFTYIKDIWIESSQREEIEDCDAVWTGVDTDVTQAVDNDDYQEGSGSIVFTVGAGISDGDVIAHKTITSFDLSPYKKVSFWIKVSSAVAAADLCLRLDNNAGCTSPLETISLPAITADTWTFVECTLANPASDTAIISVGFEYNANKKANTIKIDDIRAVLDGEPRYDAPLDRQSWSIVKASTPKIRFAGEVGITPGRTLRLEGYRHQIALTSDASYCYAPTEYIIQQAIAILCQSKPDMADRMKIAQALANDEKKNTKVYPEGKCVKEYGG